jgi:nitrate reductase NapE
MLNEQHQAPPLATGQNASEKKKEWRLFIFIIVFLFPILTVAIVGAFGFSIWFYQLIAGPPGPY